MQYAQKYAVDVWGDMQYARKYAVDFLGDMQYAQGRSAYLHICAKTSFRVQLAGLCQSWSVRSNTRKIEGDDNSLSITWS